MRSAARLLLIERDAIRPVLAAAEPEVFDLPTVCDGWSVRDVLAHCASALSRTTSGDLHRFTPADNQADVDERASWPLVDVVDELFAAYEGAASVIDRAEGRLDGIGLGEWIHGGDVREPLGAPDPYTSAGVELAVPLIVERSIERGAPGVVFDVDEEQFFFGVGEPMGAVRTDLETFVRLVSGRRPDPRRFTTEGVSVASLLLFS